MISVVILTKNEERDLPRCLEALGWCDDLHVLDSGSSDRTVEIACAFGATVSVNEFRSFGQQRNHALNALPLRHDWVLFLDADEVATPKFVAAVQRAIQSANDSVAGYYCCWKMILEETWLKRCDSFPKWQFRILRHGRATFTDFGHGQKEGEVLGEIDYVREPYLHYGFSKGWSHWVDRHNRYSTLEAAARLSQQRPLSDVFSRTASKRNPALKFYLSRVPGWPLLRFIHAYLLKGGFLEGAPGRMYCCNIAYYEFLITIKMRELRREQRRRAEPRLVA